MSERNILVNEREACRILGGKMNPIHRSTLWRGINAGRYPHPLKVGPATNRWRAMELFELLDNIAAERETIG